MLQFVLLAVLVIILVSYGCCNKLPQTWWLENKRNVLSPPSSSRKSIISFTGLKSMCWEAQAFSTGPWGECVPFYVQLLVATNLPGLWLHHSSLCLRDESDDTGEEAFLCEVKFLSISPYKDPYDCIFGAKELMLLNCGAGEDSWESHGLQGDPTI